MPPTQEELTHFKRVTGCELDDLLIEVIYFPPGTTLEEAILNCVRDMWQNMSTPPHAPAAAATAGLPPTAGGGGQGGGGEDDSLHFLLDDDEGPRHHQRTPPGLLLGDDTPPPIATGDPGGEALSLMAVTLPSGDKGKSPKLRSATVMTQPVT